jgi:two-component system LytT family response regulator
MSGFEIIEEIRTTSVKPPFIVLVTAFERYAVRAFQEEAVDYLVKPVEPARVASTVARVREYMAKTVCHEAQETWITRVAVKEPGRVQVMNMEDADWLEAAGNYVRLHMGRTSYMYRTTMNNLETRIDPRRFVRIHRTTIVNVDRISELHTSFGREHIVVLRDGTRLRLSAAYRARLAQMVAGL